MVNIGEKLKELRIQRNLTQEELADRCELSKGFISQVERNLASPSIATLTDMLECLGSDLKTFFSEAEQEEKIVFEPADMFEKTNEETLHGSIVWLVPSAQKNSMEPIRLTLMPGARTETDNPHEGEEFGYVLSGSVQLVLGEKRYRIKKGGSFYFRPTKLHYLTNAGKIEARVLWVSTPPSF